MHRTLSAPGEPWGRFRIASGRGGPRFPRPAWRSRLAAGAGLLVTVVARGPIRRASPIFVWFRRGLSAFRFRRLPADRSTLRSARIPLSGRRPRRPFTRLDIRRRSTRYAHATPVHSLRGHAQNTHAQAPHTPHPKAHAPRSAPASAKGPMPHTPRHASFRPSGTWAAQRINRPVPTQGSLEPTGHLRRPDAYATLTLIRTTPPAPGGPVASAPRPRVVPRDPEHRSRAVEEAGPAGQTPLTPYAPTLPRTHEAASSLHAPEAAFPVPPGSGRRPRWQGGDRARSVYGE